MTTPSTICDHSTVFEIPTETFEFGFQKIFSLRSESEITAYRKTFVSTENTCSSELEGVGILNAYESICGRTVLFFRFKHFIRLPIRGTDSFRNYYYSVRRAHVNATCRKNIFLSMRPHARHGVQGSKDNVLEKMKRIYLFFFTDCQNGNRRATARVHVSVCVRGHAPGQE